MKQKSMMSNQRWVALAVMLVLSLGAYQLWQMWPSLVIETGRWQRDVNAELADLLYDAKANPLVAGGYLIAFSFVYGMLHSLGPGHGKVIVSTYLATHPTKVKASLVLTIVSAIAQALVAIALVSILVWGFQASMQTVNEKATSFVSLSFLLVVVMGLLLCWKALKQIVQVMRKPKMKIKTLTALSAQPSNMSAMKPVTSFSMTANPTHSHSEHTTEHSHTDCGCGHQHVADPEAINKASTLREYIGIVVTIGVRPCTGAIMVLLFANIVGMYWMGVISALAMAGGTALTTSLIAVLTLTGKKIVKRYLTAGNDAKGKSMKVAGYYAQLFGGVLLILIGLLLLGGDASGISPVFSV
ncbi:nickel/cobalt transporter [Vibrio agarivorans]|uniref:nickel/cobalt transporter n=1 Tax=Vibrio agarivorans TaxID=153622 RepID=UPI0025B59952|nr:nickel/cobalt transporter [Vibrio agarivorans]MDN3660412.1 nickel/cobalt transporter [Vibrio agarivorans]